MNNKEFHVVKINDSEFCMYHIESQNLFKVDEATKTKMFDLGELDTNELHQSLINKQKTKSIGETDSCEVKSISLNVIQSCNMRCIYCYGDGGEYGHKDKMCEDTAFSAVDWLIKSSGECRKLGIVFFGGEPLMNFSLIKKVVEYSKNMCHSVNKVMTFSITTNGTLFTNEIINYLNEHNFGVTISLDGPKEIQDINRPLASGKGSYELIKKNNIAMNGSRGGRTTARVTVTNQNVAFKDILITSKEMGFNTTVFVPVTSDDDNSENKLCISDKRLNHIKDYYTEEGDKLLKKIKDRASNMSGSVRFIEIIRSFLLKEKREHYCGVGRTLAAVASNGDLYPCHRFVGDEKFLLGNVMNDINPAAYQKVYLKNDFTSRVECKDCFVRFHCGGGCIQDNYIINKSVEIPNSMHCDILKHQVDISIRIFGNLNKEDKEYLNNNLNFKNKQKSKLNTVTYL